jgi:hypothetical protein
MTTYGFLSTNGNSQVLISSKTKNLHFLGKATYYQTLQATNSYGGIRRWSYRIVCITTPVPFFTTPTPESYAILRMTVVAPDTWEIEIIKSGTSDTRPEVYIFTEANGQIIPNTSWGMRVLNETSGVTYDSRLGPLVVKAGGSITQPYDPLTSVPPPGALDAAYCQSDAGPYLGPAATSVSSIGGVPSITKPITNYQSISQAQRQFQVSFVRRTGFFKRSTYVYHSYYWVFCRGGISVGSSGSTLNVTSGWVAVDYSCNWTYSKESQFIGIGIGGNSRTGGTWPYENTSINMASVSFIVSDGALYD